MSAIAQTCFESLKVLALMKSNILVAAPSDAKRMVQLIVMYTDRQLAEVTILKAFDFLPSKFPPSQFTKDVLAQFCGYQDYNSFSKEFNGKVLI